MDANTLTLAIAIIIPILSALTLLAYKHPKAYQKIDTKIFFFFVFVVITLSVRDFAIQDTHSLMREYLSYEEYSASREIINSKLMITSPYTLVGIGVFIYLLFLSFLPKLLEDEKVNN